MTTKEWGGGGGGGGSSIQGNKETISHVPDLNTYRNNVNNTVSFMIHNRCEAGDLAGKFGNLMPSVDVDVTDVTGELQLSGPYSIIGRSLVIHSPSDGSNFECGTVKLVEHPGDTGSYDSTYTKRGG